MRHCHVAQLQHKNVRKPFCLEMVPLLDGRYQMASLLCLCCVNPKTESTCQGSPKGTTAGIYVSLNWAGASVGAQDECVLLTSSSPKVMPGSSLRLLGPRAQAQASLQAALAAPERGGCRGCSCRLSKAIGWSHHRACLKLQFWSSTVHLQFHNERNKERREVILSSTKSTRALKQSWWGVCTQRHHKPDTKLQTQSAVKMDRVWPSLTADTFYTHL